MNIVKRLKGSRSDIDSSNKSITSANLQSGDDLTSSVPLSGVEGMSLLGAAQETRRHLQPLSSEEALAVDERSELLKLYHDLQRVLSRNSRMGDWTSKASDWKTGIEDDFSHKFQELTAEFANVESKVQESLKHPAAVQPLTLEAIQQHASDIFILDNSLRETTVGQPRGHTLEEKHKIVKAMAETGLEEVVLGAFGSKISVDSQISEQWNSLGQSFDKTWGFSDAYDWEPIDEDPLWVNEENYDKPKTANDYYTPAMNPKTTFDKQDVKLFKRASQGFRNNAFGKFTSLRKVLSKGNSKEGRIPLGLLMMAGYGVCNAIVEVDTSMETFDFKKYDMIARLKFLTKWCKENLAKREDGKPNRVLINLRDFSNYHRSQSGLEMALRIVDAMSRLPPEERPFGFIMEEPTGWLFPSEAGRIIRMIRVTMDRAGFPEGQLLVHVHWYFGLAEATVLSCMVNGATGVWAAVCKAGAQTGHACSTMTAVNLYRAGHQSIAEKYDLAKMCDAARKVTEYSTRQPCPTHEEVYGKDAFDVPYIMTQLPSCRYSIYHVLTRIGVKDRAVRLNELSMVSSVYNAMIFHFGPPSKTGWDPEHCKKMWEALHNHLLTGLSRDYNTPLGLGHLYGLVSKQKLPWAMVQIMTENCPITDHHPVVLDFIYRWNRLCTMYEGTELSPHPAATSKSHMFWGLSAVTEPLRDWLPFEYFTADVMRNPVLEPIPRLFKMQVVSLLTRDERQIQKRVIPRINFYETILRLKLFIQEAQSFHVLGLVDDFCIRKNHDYFFGEDALWLKKVNHVAPPKIANKVLLNQMKFYHKHYIQQGDTAISRCIESTAKRIDERRAVPVAMQDAFRRESARQLVHQIAERSRDDEKEANPLGNEITYELTTAHERMLREMAEDKGEDEVLAKQYSQQFGLEVGLEESEGDGSESLADAYIRQRKSAMSNSDSSEGWLDGEPTEDGEKSTLDASRKRERRGSKQGALLRVQGTRFLEIMQEETSSFLLTTQSRRSLLSKPIDENSTASTSSSDFDDDDIDDAEMEAMLAPSLYRTTTMQ